MVGFDPVAGRSVQRSFTVHGDEDFALRRRCELVEEVGVTRVSYATQTHRLTVADLMERFFGAPHLWKPATVVSHRPVVRALIADPLGRKRLVTLSDGDVRGAICRWQATGLSVATISARWLVLRSALSWAVAEGILRSNPLAGMRGPARPQPRKHLSSSEVRRLLETAERLVLEATTRLRPNPNSARCRASLFAAEQTLLLSRLAADSGARRGELAVLRLGDLEGRVLTIERGLSHGVVGSTKSTRTRRLTLGETTTALMVDHVVAWKQRSGEPPTGDWLFSPDPSRGTYLTADALSHRFGRLATTAGVPGAALHRLRHAVATHLVGSGKVLKAQARLGHRDAATTLRHYSHAVPLDDEEVADELDGFLNGEPRH